MLQLLLPFAKAFLVGGILCAIGQILIDKTKLSPAKILVLYVVAGVVLGAAGIYGPLVEWAGAGATVPLTGFGHIMAEGMRDAVQEKGLLGIFSGAFTAGAAGIGAAVAFGYLTAVAFRPRDKA
ncbi:MAG: stage V sporulation protein AE [Oscillospiraceae bacterium]|nr:stage V sporulation protein AE [Oscillospiraceae bacterium]